MARQPGKIVRGLVREPTYTRCMHRPGRIWLPVVAILLIAGAATAQFGAGSSIASHIARPESYDGQFHYCRAAYGQTLPETAAAG